MNIDSIMYSLTPYLKKTGNQTVYYPDGTLKSVRYFEDGKMVSVVKDTVIKKDLFGNTLNYGQRKALLIGIDSYVPPPVSEPVKNPSGFNFGDQGGCVNDAEGIASVLISKRDFKKENILLVTNEDATKPGILRAFSQFTRSLKKGDFVFVHFSGYSTSDSAGDALVCRDWYKSRGNALTEGFLLQKEMDQFFDQIRAVVGREGQVIFSLDASTGGTGVKKEEPDNSGTAFFRGETNTLLFNNTQKNEAPFTLLVNTLPGELSLEGRDENGKIFGAYTLALIRTLQKNEAGTIIDLYAGIKDEIKIIYPKQNPQYYSNYNQLLFESTLFSAPPFETKLPELKQSGNGFVLSAGISQYPGSATGKLKFLNCVNDAETYAAFFQSQFSNIPGGKQLRSYLLTDTAATKEGILHAINEIISNSKPEDYFIFNFSGYCKPLNDSTGKQVTYFVPYGLKNIADSGEIKKNGIPLSQLKDLLQLVPANNQLFITEAGSTADFQKEFIQALIETSPTIAALSNKNRIFIVPRSSGLDKFFCNNVPVEHGPLNYYITSLSNELNLFGLFENGIYANAVKYAISKKEIGCDYFKSGYFDIFFEKDYIKDLQYFLPEEVMQSRGAIGTSQARDELAAGNSKRYALVMGTDKYDGKPDWNDLYNSAFDAVDIAKELKDGFGYDVKLLIDKPIDSFYAHISWLSRILKKNDQLIIYVAGHGDFDSVLLDDGFIVCKNSKPVKEDPYRYTYIQHSKLEKMVNRLPASQVILMLDVCFGGTFDERVAKSELRNKATDYDNISEKSLFAKALQKKTRLLLTSGGKNVVPDGYKGKHSPFAVRMLQALQGRGGAAKYLTSKDLFKFVERLPSGPLLGSFGDDAGSTEFILLGN